MTPELERDLGATDSIVFLCSGNVVRSAFAELYARHLGCPRPLRSAATRYRNPRLFAPTADALLARGVAPGEIRAFRPQHWEDLRPRLAGRPLLLGMKRAHLEVPGASAFAARLLGECLGAGQEIDDPVEEGADFRATFERIERCAEVLTAFLRAADPARGAGRADAPRGDGA